MKKITKIEPSGEHIAARKLRVAAYCRVSTDMEIQLASLEAQKTHYEALINSNPDFFFGTSNPLVVIKACKLPFRI